MKKLLLLALITFGKTIVADISIKNDTTSTIQVELKYAGQVFCFDDSWKLGPGQTIDKRAGICCLTHIRVRGVDGALLGIDSGLVRLEKTIPFAAICDVIVVIKEKDKQFVVEHTAKH